MFVRLGEMMAALHMLGEFFTLGSSSEHLGGVSGLSLPSHRLSAPVNFSTTNAQFSRRFPVQ
jgi:hypothetical protein